MNETEFTMYDIHGEKIGVAVSTGVQGLDRNLWEVFSTSDVSLGLARNLNEARSLAEAG